MWTYKICCFYVSANSPEKLIHIFLLNAYYYMSLYNTRNMNKIETMQQRISALVEFPLEMELEYDFKRMTNMCWAYLMKFNSLN